MHARSSVMCYSCAGLLYKVAPGSNPCPAPIDVPSEFGLSYCNEEILRNRMNVILYGVNV
jgi:hypothetical protein